MPNSIPVFCSACGAGRLSTEGPRRCSGLRRLLPGGRAASRRELQQEREALPFRKLPVDGSTRFPAYAHKWWNASGVEVDVGERYRIEASGAWIDKNARGCRRL
jgi:hypothetical protein